MLDTALHRPQRPEIRRAGVDLNGLMTVLGPKHLYSDPGGGRCGELVQERATISIIRPPHSNSPRLRPAVPSSRISVQVDLPGCRQCCASSIPVHGRTRQEIHDYHGHRLGVSAIPCGLRQGLVEDDEGADRHCSALGFPVWPFVLGVAGSGLVRTTLVPGRRIWGQTLYVSRQIAEQYVPVSEVPARLRSAAEVDTGICIRISCRCANEGAPAQRCWAAICALAVP